MVSEAEDLGWLSLDASVDDDPVGMIEHTFE